MQVLHCTWKWVGKELGSRPREEGPAYESKFLLAPGSRAQVGRRAGERAAHKTGWRRAARIVRGELRSVNVTEIVGKGSGKGSIV